MHKDTLVILTPGFPSSEEDTTCLPPVQQFCRLAGEEYPELKIIVITFQYPFARQHYQWHGVEVYAMGGRNRKKLRRLLTWLRVSALLVRLARKNKVKGILSLWLTETALVGRRFARRHKMKFYCWLQGQDARKENNYVFRSGITGAETIAISEFNARELESNHHLKPFLVAPNGVNRSVFPEFNSRERDIDLLGVGSLIPLKNYEAFVRCVHELKKQHPRINALIAGTGREERTLSELIFRLGLQHHLKLVGELPHREVLGLMNRSRILLHPSTYEGMSTVMLEALYSGCHVVSCQELGGNPVDHLRLAKTEEEMVIACEEILSGHYPAQRVVVYDMRDTVRRLIGLYVN